MPNRRLTADNRSNAARGSTDPAATARQVEQAVDRALSARIPGIVRASATAARAEVVDSWQRRGGRFD